MPCPTNFGRRTDGPTGRRGAVRERMNLQVSLYSVDQSRVALLVDISSRGCRLEGIGLPAIGRDILVVASEVELFGRVVWKATGERGIRFDQPLSDHHLQLLRRLLAGQDCGDPQVIPLTGRRKPSTNPTA